MTSPPDGDRRRHAFGLPVTIRDLAARFSAAGHASGVPCGRDFSPIIVPIPGDFFEGNPMVSQRFSYG